MATPIVMPKQGNTVESVIIVDWKKRVGEPVAIDDVLCEVETDKATMEVPSTAAGTLLATLYAAGDEVPVMATIAWIGEAGEVVPGSEHERGGEEKTGGEAPMTAPAAISQSPISQSSNLPISNLQSPNLQSPNLQSPVSPRARNLAERKGIEASALAGSGPGGRVIERDVQAAIAAQPKLTPVAKAMVAEGGFAVPAQGSGPGGRVTSKDLVKALEKGSRGEEEQRTQADASGAVAQSPISNLQSPAAEATPVEVIPVKGVRKVIAERMLHSLQTTAQLTLNASADARALQALRKRLKDSPEAMGVRGITINDLVLFAVARTLPAFPGLNALFTGAEIHQHRSVHLGIAVDTPRGLMVPVVRNAETLSLRQLSAEAKRLATACLESKITPDELTGGTFTVTNLGAFGVESFTPVLNPPQVGILGVSSIQLKPTEIGDKVKFVPHIGLSLTINHQVVDGAPAARFLQALGQAIATIDLLMVG
ncbi:MAG TPA: 2-oxo acid dehydrogenase subunit E2 [Chloroflexi bacterium]|nr:2-oxo acid dehydrogenase subunit E2 [Chloroflexota bacterium]HHW89150.1 2-oxo acid dehydrogenase subunit E2 [Chloroflexota bacterium]